MDIRTILFDLDGTLIDTNELIIQSFKYTFDQYNIPYTRDQLSTYNGPPLWKTFNEINPERAEEMIRTYREHNLSNHNKYVNLFPNVIPTLESLAADEYNLAIVTTKMKDSALYGIEEMGLMPYFETIITLDDVVHAKPHPEPVFTALDHLAAEPETAVMIGDNHHDIVAGQKAGTLTAGVAWSRKGPEYLQTYEPTYMLEDMNDLLSIL